MEMFLLICHPHPVLNISNADVLENFAFKSIVYRPALVCDSMVSIVSYVAVHIGYVAAKTQIESAKHDNATIVSEQPPLYSTNKRV